MHKHQKAPELAQANAFSKNAKLRVLKRCSS